jgi:UPF0755 protein
MRPAKTSELYFVADGTGGHAFSTNLKDHEAAVANWRRIEKEARAKGAAAGAGTTELGPSPSSGRKTASDAEETGPSSAVPAAKPEAAPTPPAAVVPPLPARKPAKKQQ